MVEAEGCDGHIIGEDTWCHDRFFHLRDPRPHSESDNTPIGRASLRDGVSYALPGTSDKHRGLAGASLLLGQCHILGNGGLCRNTS